MNVPAASNAATTNNHDSNQPQQEPLVWVPFHKRKRDRASRAQERVQATASRRGGGDDDDNSGDDEQRRRRRDENGGDGGGAHEHAGAASTSSGPRAKISLLDQIALDLIQKKSEEELASERRAAEEKELMKAFVDFKPLVSVQEAAHGVEYTEPLKRSWVAPRWLQKLSSEQTARVRENFHILTSGDDVPPPVTRFGDLKLPRAIIDELQSSGITRPTPIQMQGLPAVLSGRDIIGVAFTGSGKSLTFALPMMLFALEAELRLPLQEGEGPIGIVMCPSRELAKQTFDLCERLATALMRDNFPKLKGSLLIGGVSKSEQLRDMRNGWHFAVATPGRINDLLNSRAFNLTNCTYLVLDEADRLVDMGFEDEMRNVMNHFEHQRQTLLFSATMPVKIQQFARSALVKPIEVNVGRSGAANLDVIQEVEYVKDEAKIVHLLDVLQKTAPPVLIFCENKSDVDDIHEYLLLKGVDATSVHGGRTQDERNEAIRLFKAGQKDVLIATDVASKGLDFANVQHVINFDMPKEIENYVHRIGRTGRGGKTGIATTFINRGSDETVLLDLKYLLIEAKQRLPLVLQTLQGPYDGLIGTNQNKGGCLYCGGLGHSVLQCTKITNVSRKMQGAQREFLRE
jgi:ATP-dependent RNA helicase DDX41